MINSKVIYALDSLNIPVHFMKYDGDEEKYIIFQTVDIENSKIYDDDIHGEVIDVILIYWYKNPRDTIIINEMDVNYVQKDVKIKKTQYKDKIFQYIIILTDYETQKNIEYEDFLKNDDIYTFEETGIQYRSYKKALAQFKKDRNYYINERYVIKVTNQTIQTRYNNLKDNDYEKLFES